MAPVFFLLQLWQSCELRRNQRDAGPRTVISMIRRQSTRIKYTTLFFL